MDSITQINYKPIKFPQHNTFHFQLDQHKIQFDSNFDSGNCGKVNKRNNFEYDVWTAPDCDQINEQEGFSKSWFYFSVKGFPPKSKVKFNIQRVHMLLALKNSKSEQSYRPIYKINEGEWLRFKYDISLNYFGEDNLVLSFIFTFEDKSDQIVYFAFSYPYPYQQCVNLIRELTTQFINDEQIYFNKEVLIYTQELRYIHLLTISSHEHKTDTRENYISDALFPERQYEQRSFKFKSRKPYILITARVHPGESPSSYALDGMIKFLLNKQDARAALLRKFFVFLIVPMLNPDGVYAGHYRKDIYNQNLNRFYKLATNQKQPSIYAIRHIVEYLNEEKRLFFYIDLHSHAGKKGHFLYGNALDEMVQQVESQVFAKILSLNCKHFEYSYCNFSKKQMNSRDRFEEMTKEGCARVCVYNTTNIIHSFSLECGFHQATQLNILSEATNTDFQINDNCKYVDDEIDNNDNEIYKQENPPFFDIAIYENVGKATLISMLDIFQKNPYTRITSSSYKNIDAIRKEIAWECTHLDRFRKDPLAYRKARNITEYVYQYYNNDFVLKNVFQLDGDIDINSINWPESLKQNGFLTKFIQQDLTSLNQPNPTAFTISGMPLTAGNNQLSNNEKLKKLKVKKLIQHSENQSNQKQQSNNHDSINSDEKFSEVMDSTRSRSASPFQEFNNFQIQQQLTHQQFQLPQQQPQLGKNQSNQPQYYLQSEQQQQQSFKPFDALDINKINAYLSKPLQIKKYSMNNEIRRKMHSQLEKINIKESNVPPIISCMNSQGTSQQGYNCESQIRDSQSLQASFRPPINSINNQQPSINQQQQQFPQAIQKQQQQQQLSNPIHGRVAWNINILDEIIRQNMQVEVKGKKSQINHNASTSPPRINNGYNNTNNKFNCKQNNENSKAQKRMSDLLHKVSSNGQQLQQIVCTQKMCGGNTAAAVSINSQQLLKTRNSNNNSYKMSNNLSKMDDSGCNSNNNITTNFVNNNNSTNQKPIFDLCGTVSYENDPFLEQVSSANIAGDHKINNDDADKFAKDVCSLFSMPNEEKGEQQGQCNASQNKLQEQKENISYRQQQNVLDQQLDKINSQINVLPNHAMLTKVVNVRKELACCTSSIQSKNNQSSIINDYNVNIGKQQMSLQTQSTNTKIPNIIQKRQTDYNLNTLKTRNSSLVAKQYDMQNVSQQQSAILDQSKLNSPRRNNQQEQYFKLPELQREKRFKAKSLYDHLLQDMNYQNFYVLKSNKINSLFKLNTLKKLSKKNQNQTATSPILE